MRRLLALCLAPALGLVTGCATVQGPSRVERMDALMGRTELSLVREFGVPDAEITAEGQRILRWSRDSVEVVADPFPWGPFGPRGYAPPVYGYGYGYGYPVAAQAYRRWCDMELEFERADALPDTPWRATAWRTRGNDCR